MTLNNLTNNLAIIGQNSNYLSYNLRTNSWKIEHFNWFEKIIRVVAIRFNVGEKYTNTRLSHVLTYLDAQVSPELTRKMEAIWQKTYPSILSPLEAEQNWQELLAQVSPYRDKLEQFVREIRHLERNTVGRNVIIPAIYVLAGLKPVLTENGAIQAHLLRQFQRQFPHLKIFTIGEDTYLVNENPLPLFHPKKYIAGFSETIEKGISYAFPKLGLKDTDQRLSYLLGFGPTWEAYAGRNKIEYEDDAELSVFSDEHYLELGRVLNPNGSREDQIQAGRKYHDNYKTHPYEKTRGSEVQELDKTYNGFVADSISFKTPYLQKKIALQKHLLEWLKLT